MNLFETLEATTRRRADHPVLEWGDKSMTYRELYDLAEKAASVFVGHKVLPGDRVLVMTTNDPGFLVAAYGLWRLGAVLVPVNHKMAPPEIEYIAQTTRAVCGVVSDSLVDTARAGAPDIPWMTTGWEPGEFEAATDAADPYTGPLAESGDYAQVLFTSGSTGYPKGCMHTHRGIGSLGPAICSNMPFDKDERHLLAMPIWHASPLNNWALTTVFTGGTLVLMREYDAPSFLEVLESKRITSVFGAPIAFIGPVQLAKAKVEEGARQPKDYDLSAMKMLIYGASPLGEDMARMLIDAYGTENFYQVYGMTEAGPAGSVLKPEDQIRKAGSIGKAGMLGVNFRVQSDSGEEVTANGEGEIWLKCPSMMSVYLSDPEATAETFIDGWFRTGDIARVDEDGYAYLIDRKKDVIITGGENVYSAQVEEAIRGMPEVRDVAVVGREHPEWGETVVAVIVTDEGQLLSLEEVRAHLADKVAKYMHPREIKIARGLPRNPSGKLLKHVIRQEINEEK